MLLACTRLEGKVDRISSVFLAAKRVIQAMTTTGDRYDRLRSARLKILLSPLRRTLSLDDKRGS